MTPTDLQRFCADENNPLWPQPWTRDGYTWATDGKILVRVPALADVPENPAAPDTTKPWNKAPAPKQWIEVPKTAMPDPIACPWCDGSGKDIFDRRYKCRECNGARKILDYNSNTKLGNAYFANRYLALIQGWEIAPNGPSTPAWIRSGEALGLLMPMRL